ncbi:helix-turn-helix domain-containing protein [Acetobacterium paludosum]|uniref:Helix-turn-helix domain-containing protein n=1 Tax=Acetobacterium paludosum TaxID=52693 RepID=A0A923KR21_9FIRM|nr:helix-turn-helix transcriptional regulator [Acetobacterium paludosum]MBC3886792.1 helix-turn-helix domain-containing protein [Acetobacterium paludosum]
MVKNKNKIGENIKKIRRQCGYTQADLGKELDVSAVMISQWERGERNPKAENIKKIANVFNINDKLITGKDPKIMYPRVFAAKKTENKKQQSLGKGLAELFPDEVLLTNDTFDELDHEYLELFEMLNKQGKLKAIEFTEILTKVPEFVIMLEDDEEDM